MRRPRTARARGRAAAGIVAALLLMVGVACSNDEKPQTTGAAPSTQDAIRMAQAASDALINLAPPFVTLGPLEQQPYRCSTPEPCIPREQYVERTVTPKGVTNAQIAKFYIDNLAASGWRVEAAFCDEGRNEYAVVATKRTNASKTYPGRFELFDKDTVRLRITMPAFGAETTFALVPDPTSYPAGVCPDNIKVSVDNARKAVEKNSPTTIGNNGGGGNGTAVPITADAPGTTTP